MPQSHKDIAAIVDMFEASGIEELVIELPDVSLALRRSNGGEGPEPDPSPRPAPKAETPASAAPPRAAPLARADGASEVRAPTIGTFLRAAEPAGRPLVAVGDTVATGQPLGLIRVLKRDTAIESPRTGRIANIAAESGALVEYDQILFVIAPA
jgi:acetyl-CoA carboxylase biotin carboxyl carrier protein